MTREEAKIFLLQLHTDKQLNKSEHEALRIAVKELEQEPCREADDYENEISDLYNRLDIAEYDKERLREEVTTLEEKLKGLSAEPCEDAISRAEVIDELNRIGRNAFKEDTDYDNFFAFLDNLPPVTPRPKTGVLEQKTCVTMRNLSDKELKHFVEEMKKVRPQVIRQEPCADAISRQAIIDMTGLSEWFDSSDSYNEFVIALSELPPVTPQPKTGRWIEYGHNISDSYIWDGVKCSVCKKDARVKTRFIKREPVIWDRDCFELTSYCPNCGAKMLPTDSEKE